MSAVQEATKRKTKVAIMNAGAIALFLLLGLVVYFDLSKTSLLRNYLP